MSAPEQQLSQDATGDLSAPDTAVDAGSVERPKGPVEVNFRVTLGSEIQMARFMDAFSRGLMEVGVQGSDIKNVATADRVTVDLDGVRVLERVPQIGPRQ